jgi:hypothetical protein
MARAKARVGPTQKWIGYGILGVLGLIAAWLLVEQSRFNPAVIVAMSPPQLKDRSPAVSGQGLSATAALIPEVSGFTPLAPIQSYGPENLSDKIDGKAELYLAAGFKEMSCRSYRLSAADQAHVEVFLYDMGSAANAYAVFSGQRRPGSPSLSLTTNAYATANALFFAKGRYYLEIVADRPSEAVISSLKAYATTLLANIPAEGETKDRAALLPKEGLTPDSVRLSPADTFGLEGFNNVLTGEYSLKSGRATVFVTERDTPEQAQAEARRYQDFLVALGYQEIGASGAPADTAVLALDNSFTMVLVQERTLAGVHDAASLAAALELAGKLKEALEGKP